ncbi:MAG TPA: succinic semialdehyde dehydrogenase [Nocardioidaceae bacterium]|nr:succinic semialdehyde dehydrogenase [Nocardioidaceae bacterium]
MSRLAVRVVATSGREHTSYAPFTGEPIATLETSSPADVAEAVRRAQTAQRSWSRVPLDLRAAILLRFHDLVFDRQRELLDLVQLESGKARKHAFEEVAHVALTARYYARTAGRLLRTSRRRGVLPLLTRVDVHRVPKGVVGVISPWNYPFSLAMCDGLPALVAGNTVVHKPDSQGIGTALLGVELLTEAGLPADAWQVVHGDGPVLGPPLVDAVDYLSFTGSTGTGRQVATRAAERLVGASLELGGKNPMLVLHDADLDRAADGAVRACFSSAGQICVGVERLFVADQVYEEFVERFLRRVHAQRLSAAFDYTGDVGSLVSAAQLDRVAGHVEDARAKGAVVLAGGRPRPDVGPWFYEPTVLAHVTPEMACFGEETFGPVVSLYRFTDETDAVARANDGTFGLNASIYTSDGARGRRLARAIRSGTVNVNEAYGATFGSIDAPMGGMRDSGLGRRQGPEGIYRYVDQQAVATQRAMPLAAPPGLSDERYARLMTGAFRLLNRLHRP